jgi:hypothetical protein
MQIKVTPECTPFRIDFIIHYMDAAGSEGKILTTRCLQNHMVCSDVAIFLQ